MNNYMTIDNLVCQTLYEILSEGINLLSEDKKKLSIKRSELRNEYLNKLMEYSPDTQLVNDSNIKKIFNREERELIKNYINKYNKLISQLDSEELRIVATNKKARILFEKCMNALSIVSSSDFAKSEYYYENKLDIKKLNEFLENYIKLLLSDNPEIAHYKNIKYLNVPEKVPSRNIKQIAKQNKKNKIDSAWTSKIDSVWTVDDIYVFKSNVKE